jgi:putative membrane protein
MSGAYPVDAHPPRRWMWLPLVFAAALVAVLVGSWLYFGAPGPAYAGPWPVWWFPFGWFLFIPVIFLVIFSIRWFFWGGWGWGWGWRGGYYDPALETLRERFARGEITKDQFEQMRRDLQGSGSDGH